MPPLGEASVGEPDASADAVAGPAGDGEAPEGLAHPPIAIATAAATAALVNRLAGVPLGTPRRAVLPIGLPSDRSGWYAFTRILRGVWLSRNSLERSRSGTPVSLDTGQGDGKPALARGTAIRLHRSRPCVSRAKLRSSDANSRSWSIWAEVRPTR